MAINKSPSNVTPAKAQTSEVKNVPADQTTSTPKEATQDKPSDGGANIKAAQEHHDSLSKTEPSPEPVITEASGKTAGEANKTGDVEAVSDAKADGKTGEEPVVIHGDGDPNVQTALKAHGVPANTTKNSVQEAPADAAVAPVTGQNAEKPTAEAIKDAKGGDVHKPVVPGPKVSPQAVKTDAAAAAQKATDGAKLTVPAGEMDAPEKYLEKIPKSKQGFYGALQGYAAAMAPNKPMTIEEGIGHQRGLYKILQNLINNESENFHYSWLAVLAFAYRERNGVFAPKNVMRFMDNVNLSKDEIKSFQRILDLIMMTADPKSRKERLAQVDIEDVLRYELNNAGRERMREFYDKFK